MEIVVHPLVCLNISDHLTRAAVVSKGPVTQTLAGCIMGTQMGMRAEFFTSFQVNIDGGEINAAFLRQRCEQIQTCYPEYTILAWYLVGGPAEAKQLDFFHKFSKITETKLYLLAFDPSQTSDEKQFTLFDLSKENKLVQVPFITETLEPERISVDTMDSILPGSDQSAESLYVHHLTSLQNVLKLLTERVQATRKYLADEVKAVAEKKPIAKNYQLLRTIESVVSSVPTTLSVPLPSKPTSSSKSSSTTSSSSSAAASASAPPATSTVARMTSSALTHAFLSEFSESATIIALSRMLPLLNEFEREKEKFEKFMRERKEKRADLQMGDGFEGIEGGESFFGGMRRMGRRRPAREMGGLGGMGNAEMLEGQIDENGEINEDFEEEVGEPEHN